MEARHDVVLFPHNHKRLHVQQKAASLNEEHRRHVVFILRSDETKNVLGDE